MAQGTNGTPPQAVAHIEIVMLANGTVQARCQVPNRGVLLLMCEQAKIDLERKLFEEEQKAKEQAIELPNRGIILG